MTQDVLWTPAPERAACTQMAGFMARHGFADHDALQSWSVSDPGAFWSAVWDDCDVIGDRPGPALVDGHDIVAARFFPDARLNHAENCLSHEGDGPALIFRPEVGADRTLSWAELRARVSVMQQALRAEGIGPGDRVAGLVANVPEALIAMLATTSLGAVWCSCSPDFGTQSVLDRFAQIAPKLLFASEAYSYKGKCHCVAEKAMAVAGQIGSLRRVVLLPFDEAPAPQGAIRLADWLAGIAPAPLQFDRQPFNAPLFILFSSGTSGAPKCIVHSIGGTLLQHLKEHRLHCDLRPGDRLFFFSTASWMMWNWMASALASGATLVLYDGSPFYPAPDRLWQMAADLRISHFGTSPRYLDTLRAEGLHIAGQHDLAALRMVLSTGAPLGVTGFHYVYKAVKPDVHLASISGGTDIISCFLLGNPMASVRAGQLQGPGLGMDMRVLDPETGHPTDGPGELACATPFPSRPIGFWNDPEGCRYREAYFARFDNLWCQHDLALRHASGGFEVLGRSDATLNPGGVRIGASEIYRALDDARITAAAVVGCETGSDVELVLFVTCPDRGDETPAFAQKIRRMIRAACTPRHVPDHVLFVTDLPRTRNGKLSEGALRSLVNGRPVANADQLENSDCLAEIRRQLAQHHSETGRLLAGMEPVTRSGSGWECGSMAG